MPYALAPGISFCRVAGSTVVLDLQRDRYLQLPPELAQRLDACEADPRSPALSQAPLLRLGLVVEREQPAVAATVCPTPSRDLTAGWALRADGLVEALLALETTHWRLRRRGLLATVEQVRRRPPAISTPARTRDLFARALRFRAARGLSPRAPVCLADSVALVSVLARRGHRPSLVFGVDLQPFAAHSWVQADDVVLNDTLDHVRAYQPILVA